MLYSSSNFRVICTISSKPGLTYSSACKTLIIPSTSSVMQTPKADEPQPGSRPTDFCVYDLKFFQFAFLSLSLPLYPWYGIRSLQNLGISDCIPVRRKVIVWPLLSLLQCIFFLNHTYSQGIGAYTSGLTQVPSLTFQTNPQVR